MELLWWELFLPATCVENTQKTNDRLFRPFTPVLGTSDSKGRPSPNSLSIYERGMIMSEPLYRIIAATIGARKRCQAASNVEWESKHDDLLRWIEENLLPSGSGIDRGTQILEDESIEERIKLGFSYHHMNDGGYYDGWTEHTLTIRPSLVHQIDLKISGSDRNQIKDYLYEVYHYELCKEYEYTHCKESPLSLPSVTV